MDIAHQIKSYTKPAWLQQVNKTSLRFDFMAGLTGAVMVLPQGIAFAMIAGMPPIYGLYAAMVIPVLAGYFGSSLHMVTGPATAISLAIYTSISPFAEPFSQSFISLVLLLTFLVGAIQLAFGLLRLGKMVNFVSHSVVVGFTAGAAILIINSQIKNVFGFKIAGNAFFDPWVALFQQFSSIQWQVPFIALIALAISLAVKLWKPKWPFLLLGMVVATVVSFFMGGDAAGIPTVGSFQAGLPPYALPDFGSGKLLDLVPGAFAVAMLGLIEAIAIGKSIGLSSGQRIDINKEFVGQGISNFFGSFLSSFAGSGSFTRSGVNYTAGAKTPLSAIFSALILLFMLLFIAPLAAHLPIPAMGGIILLVGYSLIDVKEIKAILHCSRSEFIVLALTFFSTLLIELEYAILLGIITSLVFFLLQISAPNIAIMAPNPKKKSNQLVNIIRKPELKECPQIKIVRIDGPIFYGSIDHIADFFEEIHQSSAPHCLILAEGINFIGLQGSHWLVSESKKWKAKGGNLYFANLKIIAQDTLIKGGFKDAIGPEHFFGTKPEAIAYIYTQIPTGTCNACTAKVFRECKEDAMPVVVTDIAD